MDEIDKVNIILQKKTITISTASRLIESLKNKIQTIRNENINTLRQQTVDLAKSLNIEPTFEETRKRKIRKQFDYEASDDGSFFDESHKFRIAYLKALDTIIDQLDWRFQKLKAISEDFGFPSGSNIKLMNENMLKKILF